MKKTYGIKKEKFNLEGQLLHAKTIGFIHPSTGEAMEFDSDIPDYFYHFDMWQYSSKGAVPGIKGNVDLNISFKDYSK